MLDPLTVAILLVALTYLIVFNGGVTPRQE